ncbi:hypothetical protein ACFU44_13050 [Nocardia rhizosphaerihabitans]|uniref:hypothetical protein n=1 Tax=Nocardia rhizosphaerihabitans TaxID=1691570 RepID=UPI00366F57C5
MMKPLSDVLTNLQDRGLVERTPHAWHKNVLETRLTEAGREVTAAGDVRAVAVERDLAARFTAEELATVTALLTRTAEALDEIRAELP